MLSLSPSSLSCHCRPAQQQQQQLGQSGFPASSGGFQQQQLGQSAYPASNGGFQQTQNFGQAGVPQQTRTQESVPAAPLQSGATSGGAQAPKPEEEPGFFGRLFGRKKAEPLPGTAEAVAAANAATAANQGPPRDPTQPVVVDPPLSARCFPSKPMDHNNAEKLRTAPLAPSK